VHLLQFLDLRGLRLVLLLALAALFLLVVLLALVLGFVGLGRPEVGVLVLTRSFQSLAVYPPLGVPSRACADGC
jgi:hypothetical protein